MAGRREQQQSILKNKTLPAIPAKHRVEHDVTIDEGSGTSPALHRPAQELSYIEGYEFGDGFHAGESSEKNASTSANNGHNLPSPPHTPPTIGDDEEDYTADDDGDPEAEEYDYRNYYASSSSDPPPTTGAKTLPSVPEGPSEPPEHSQYLRSDQAKTTLSSPNKRKNSYFRIGRIAKKFTIITNAKKPKKNLSPTVKPIQITDLPFVDRTSPISHQIPQDYLASDYDDRQSDVQTTPDLTMDDLYHLVLNMQKGFEVQVEQMSTQIKELKRDIRRLKGEDSESEPEQQQEVGTAVSVRSTTREMERSGADRRWFHNENLEFYDGED